MCSEHGAHGKSAGIAGNAGADGTTQSQATSIDTHTSFVNCVCIHIHIQREPGLCIDESASALHARIQH